MKRIIVLKDVLIRTHIVKMVLYYLLFLALDAYFIYAVDPAIKSYGDALWYCYAVISTAGFGDVVVTTTPAKVASVILTIYSIFVIALVTGVIVNYYNQLIKIKQRYTLSAIIDKMERLPELSKVELYDLSRQAKNYFHDDNLN